jgi:serine protease Do
MIRFCVLRPYSALFTAAATLASIFAASADVPEIVAERTGTMKFDRAYGREQNSIKSALTPVVAAAAQSTHRVFADGSHAALATAVHSEGWLLTKASEIALKGKLEIECAGGLRLPASVMDRLDAYDLALLKVEANGLKPVVWSDQPVPTPGSFLAAPSPSEGVAAVGVASVGPRNLYERPKGYLGVQLRRRDGTAAIIDEVFSGGAAERAGLKPDDVILSVEAVGVGNSDALIGEISKRRPGEDVKMKVRRGTEELDLTVTLMDRRDFMAHFSHGDDPMVLMSGRLSRHRRGFFHVFQHDLVLAPEECGGPLVDLNGQVVGLDIARSGRVESLAIPAADLKSLLAGVTTGKFTLPNLESLREDLKKADLAILAAQQARIQAEKTLQRAHQLHATVPERNASTTAAAAAAETRPAPEAASETTLPPSNPSSDPQPTAMP